MTKNISKLLTLLLVTVVVMIGLVTYLFMPNHNPFHLDDELLPKYQVLLFDLAMANSTVPPKGEEAYKVWQR